jgi:glycosyltransferase involved in cell wall biosynthesis
MPTVLLFSWFYLPFVGGSELFVRAITSRLAHRYRFFIVTARGDRRWAKREERPEGQVIRVGVGARVDKFLYPLPAVRAAIALANVDLVHAVMVNAAALSAWTYLRFRPRPSLLTLQSGDSEEYVRSYLGPTYPLYRFLHRPFDRIHAISSHLRDRAVRFGASPESITVIPNGVELERFDPAGFQDGELEALRSRLGVEGKRVIVSVSRLALKNGLDTLIRAFALLAPRHPDAMLLLVGDGEDREKLESLARYLQVRDRVVFAGEVKPEEAPRHLAISEVFARPSLSEGLGNAFLEAMASRLPVVATPVGGIPDIVRAGENGVFCRVGDPDDAARAIAELLENREAARRMGESGRALVAREYQWDFVAERIGRLYDELLSSR